MGCITVAGTSGVVSLPKLIWNGACCAWCRWRGVSHLGGSFSVGGSTELNKPPARACARKMPDSRISVSWNTLAYLSRRLRAAIGVASRAARWGPVTAGVVGHAAAQPG